MADRPPTVVLGCPRALLPNASGGMARSIYNATVCCGCLAKSASTGMESSCEYAGSVTARLVKDKRHALLGGRAPLQPRPAPSLVTEGILASIDTCNDDP